MSYRGSKVKTGLFGKQKLTERNCLEGTTFSNWQIWQFVWGQKKRSIRISWD